MIAIRLLVLLFAPLMAFAFAWWAHTSAEKAQVLAYFASPFIVKVAAATTALIALYYFVTVLMAWRARKSFANMLSATAQAFWFAKIITLVILVGEGMILTFLLLAVPEMLAGRPQAGLAVIVVGPWLWCLWAVGRILFWRPGVRVYKVSGADLDHNVHPQLFELVNELASRAEIAPPDHIAVTNGWHLEVTRRPIATETQSWEGITLLIPRFVFNRMPRELFKSQVLLELMRARERQSPEYLRFLQLWGQITAIRDELSVAGGIAFPGLILVAIFIERFDKVFVERMKQQEFAAIEQTAALSDKTEVQHGLIFFKYLQVVYDWAGKWASENETEVMKFFDDAERDLHFEGQHWGRLGMYKINSVSGVALATALARLGPGEGEDPIGEVIRQSRALEPVRFEVLDLGVGKLRAESKQQVLSQNRQDAVWQTPREKLQEYFPDIVFRYKKNWAYMGTVGFLLFWVGCMSLLLLPSEKPRSMGDAVGYVALVSGVFLGAAVYAFSYRRRTITVTSEGVRLSIWPQTLKFDSVKEIRARRNAGQIVVHFKIGGNKDHPFAGTRWAWFFRNDEVLMDIFGYETKYDKLYSEILRYYGKNLS